MKIRDFTLLASEKMDRASVWHNRFRHTNVAMVRDIASKETDLGLDVKANQKKEHLFCRARSGNKSGWH